MNRSTDWRPKLAKKLAPLGDGLFALQKELSTRGFAAYAPMQASLFQEAKDGDEEKDLGRYLSELAKETVGSFRHPGTALLAGDAYVSDYLEKLRDLRNSKIGGVDEYRNSPTRWLFEINPVFRRIATRRAEQPAHWEKTAVEIRAETEAVRRAEQERHFGSVEGNYASASERAGALRAALQEGVREHGRMAAGARRLQRFSNLAVIPIGADWNACLCLMNASSYSGLSSGGTCLVECKIYIARGAPEHFAKLAVFPVDEGLALRMDECIYGFSAYSLAKNLGEIALCVKARFELLRILRGPLSSILA
jgi:hypothetical protein